MMNEQQIIQSPAQPRREDARDLQSRLYREIGLAAVAAELFAPELMVRESDAPREKSRANVTVIRASERAA
jgi:hypothetical protein